MTHLIHFNKKNHQKVLSVVRGNFDNPKLEATLVKDEILFSGWFLEAEKNNIEIKIKSLNNSFTIPIDTKRIDVINALNLSIEHLNCGFYHLKNLSKYEEYTLTISVNQKEYEIWRVEPISQEEKREIQIKYNWEKYHNLYPKKTKRLDTDQTKKKEKLEIDDLFIKTNASEIYEDYIKEANSPFNNFSEFQNFIERFKDNEWAIENIIKAKKDGFIFSELNDTHSYYAIASFMINDYNYILFNGLGFKFYLAQHCTNVSIIFPNAYRYIPLNVESWADQSIANIKNLYNKLEALHKEDGFRIINKPAEFRYLNLTQSRPYHYIYDHLHCLEYISRFDIKIDVVSKTGYDFLDVKKFFNCVNHFSTVEEDDFNRQCALLRQCFIMPCLQYYRSTLDKDLVSLSDVLSKKIEVKDKEKDLFDLRLWIGVSVEKRRWIEQTEGIIAILKRLKRSYKKMCVVIDGHTITKTKDNKNEELIKKELEIYSKIKNELPEISFTCLIGSEMEEKLSQSQKIDIFLCSYFTDSIYTSCLMKKKGVVYSAPSVNIDQKKLHIHHNIIEVPKEKVIEVNTEGTEWHARSVSINWKDIFDCIENILKKVST